MEDLYEDDKIKVKCSSLGTNTKNYDETNKTLFTRTLHELHISLGCGNTHWEGCCYICALVLLEIIHKHKVWFNVGREFFLPGMIKFGCFNNILYCIDTVCDQMFHKDPCLQVDIYIFVNYLIYITYIQLHYVRITILKILQP